MDAGKVPAIRELSGANEFEVEAKDPVWKKFITKFYEDPLILLLLASAAVSVVVGNYDDAASILAAIFIVVTGASLPSSSTLPRSAFVRVRLTASCRITQSASSKNNGRKSRSKRSTSSCRITATSSGTSRCSPVPRAYLTDVGLCSPPPRNGQKTTVLANVLVPGDLVTFHTGDRIPADIRLTQAHGLEIDESALTGETRPARKQTEAIQDASIGLGGIPISERHNIAFMGTLVRSGRGEGIVVGTGVQSEFGVVFSMMQEVEEKKTPLQVSMDELAKRLSLISFGVIGIICLIGVIQHRSWLEMFTIGGASSSPASCTCDSRN